MKPNKGNPKRKPEASTIKDGHDIVLIAGHRETTTPMLFQRCL